MLDVGRPEEMAHPFFKPSGWLTRARTAARRVTPALIASSLVLLTGLLSGIQGVSLQGAPATISGDVRSLSGKALASAKLTLTNEDNSSTQSAQSSEDGEFVFTSVAIGTYALTVTSEGFKPATRAHIDVKSAQPVTLGFTLTPLGAAGSISARPSYDDSTPMKPSSVDSTVDAGGYSSPGQARTSNRLLQGVTGMKRGSGAARNGPGHATEGMDPKALAAMEAHLKQEIEKSPKSYEANHNLGEFYLEVRKSAAGVPYLETAEHLGGSHYDNGFDLALAYVDTGQPVKARDQIRQMMARPDTADLHNLLGEAEESAGDYAAAAHEYERAAHMDPSEENIFDWGSELLLHRAFDAAIQVFTGGVERYPHSAMLQIGYGVALYSRGRYEESIKAMCVAADLTPTDPRPYMFLGKMYNVSASNAGEILVRLEHFVKVQPQNAQAFHYYAMSLWKGQLGEGGRASSQQIESLLRQALALDPKFAEAYFQLGNLYAELNQFPEAVKEYKQATALQPDMADAHYRLAQAYTRTGEPALAKQELEIHDRMRKQQLAESERQRAEIQKFVDSLKENPKP
jgi:tetratricopeptide (TPR) repeat protein